ncbi:hypothetical protein [Sporosarcina koreensis]|uniref:hypothetical protein n=1 Tax=Sporosarcina koreensis TaxID=334735 RepID=UPI000758F4B1|nr:hypothetical protein [Sporosarcina koreensis]
MENVWNDYRIKQYKDIAKISDNDHVLCVRVGQMLSGCKGSGPFSWMNTSSAEDAAIGYYEYATKHKPLEQRVKNPSEILIWIEDEYGIAETSTP